MILIPINYTYKHFSFNCLSNSVHRIEIHLDVSDFIPHKKKKTSFDTYCQLIRDLYKVSGSQTIFPRSL